MKRIHFIFYRKSFHVRPAEREREKKRAVVWGKRKVHSALCDNECFVRKNPSMVTRGRETSGKVMVCWVF